METLEYIFYLVPSSTALSFAAWFYLIWALYKILLLFIDIFSTKEES